MNTGTGYVYLRARYYDPATGQFLTRDPLSSVTREPYGYTGNDPINRIDPTGLIDLPFKVPEWVPMVGGSDCVDIFDGDCESNAERMVDKLARDGTHSACIGPSVYVVFGAKFDTCYTWQGGDLAGGAIQISPGIGMGTPSGGFGGSYNYSNACDPHELSGLSFYSGASTAWVGVEGSVGATNEPVVSGGPTVARNYLPWPEWHAGVQFTWTIDL